MLMSVHDYMFQQAGGYKHVPTDASPAALLVSQAVAGNVGCLRDAF